MSRYRKRPIEVEAHRWDGTFEGAMEIIERIRDEGGTAHYRGPKIQRELVIDTLEGRMFASPGDWVIRGVAGEFYPCKPNIFEATYEPVEDENEEGAP
jgi:hypothetical protein